MRLSELKSAVPEGQSGPWCVEKFEITEDEAKFQNMRAAFSFSDRGLYVRPGHYTRLLRNGAVIMSDTQSEISDLGSLRWRAKGDVLINGLGLGLAVQVALAKEDVSSVTVIEISEDVVSLVAPHIADGRLTIELGDAYTWRPPKGKRYGAVWHDIWDNICADNLPEMSKLHRRYGRRCDWQGSWARKKCRR